MEMQEPLPVKEELRRADFLQRRVRAENLEEWRYSFK
jgi:hypothetical protein